MHVQNTHRPQGHLAQGDKPWCSAHVKVEIPREGLGWGSGPHRLFDDPQHRPLDVSDGLGVHGCQLVDQLVVLRQEGQVEVQALLYCLLSPGRCHL